METVYIYVIGQECGPVKVGISRKPWGRAVTIGTSSPLKVSLLYCHPMRDWAHAREHEKSFHMVYEENRLHGEWFNLTLELAIDGIVIGLLHEQHFEEENSTRTYMEALGLLQ